MPLYDKYSLGAYFAKDPALRGYWPMRSNALDVSGTGNNGTISEAFLQPGTPSRIPAYYFDGVNDYIALTPSANLEVFPLSILASVKTATFGAGTYTIYAYLPKGAADDGLRGVFLKSYISAGVFYLDLQWGSAGGWELVQAASVIKSNRSFLIAATIDSSVAKLFVNGRQVASNPVVNPITYTDGPGTTPAAKVASIGASRFSAAFMYSWFGTIGEVGLFARALPPQEISNYHQKATSPIPQNLSHFDLLAPVFTESVLVPVYTIQVRRVNYTISPEGIFADVELGDLEAPVEGPFLELLRKVAQESRINDRRTQQLS